MRYTTSDIAEAAGMPLQTIFAYLRRGQFHPSADAGRAGHELTWGRMDALQAALLLELRRAGVPPRRAVQWWRIVEAQEDIIARILFVRDRRVIGVGRDGDETPDGATAIPLRPIMRRVYARLRLIEGERSATDPRAYPFRKLFLSPNPSAGAAVLIVDHPGEPDLETIAAAQDAIEARKSVIVAARCADGLEAGSALVDGLLRAAPVEPTH